VLRVSTSYQHKSEVLTSKLTRVRVAVDLKCEELKGNKIS
jgi:hypothetical protein